MTAVIAQSAKRAAPTLFSRQRRLLELLDALGGALSMRDFQELLFLYCEGLGAEDAPYDFVPYKEGAFSFTSDADRRKLIERGLLLDEDGWCLSDAGREVIGRERRDELIAFAKMHRELRGAALAAELYRRFPFFAIRSEDAEGVLEEDEAALARIRTLEARMVGPALSTIGYEGRSLESYLTVLIMSGVTLLCDVRRNPLSRKYGFSKNALARGCEAVGLRYEHLPELGIASDRRRALKTQADYDALFEEYERDSLPSSPSRARGSASCEGPYRSIGQRN